LVYTYEKVVEIKKKFEAGEEISQEEIEKIANYVSRKKEVAEIPKADWPRKQLANAEMLLHKIQTEKSKVTAGER